MVDAVDEARGSKLRIMRADGGTSASDSLMQFQVDILGIPVERSQIRETTVYGASLSCRVSHWPLEKLAGACKVVEIGSQVHPENEF